MPTKKYLHNIDLAQNELISAVLQKSATDPLNPVDGQIYYNTTSHKIKFYNAAINEWSPVDENIYTTNGSLTSNRTIDSAYYNLTFTGIGSKILKATNTNASEGSDNYGQFSVYSSATENKIYYGGLENIDDGFGLFIPSAFTRTQYILNSNTGIKLYSGYSGYYGNISSSLELLNDYSLVYTAQGSVRFKIFNGGNVSIGNSADSGLAKFQVSGSIQQTSVVSSILKANSNGVLVAAVAGTDYLTSYTETDPIYVASSWYTTTNNSSNWNTAYGWGNHASAGYQLTSAKGVANGYASLDSGGKVPVAQLPSSIMEYKGVWNASTNSPTLANGTGDTGDVYRVSVAGSQNLGSGSITFDVGDYVIYNGTTWEKSDTTDAVASVNGLTGVVVLSTTNISEGTNLYYTDARARGAISLTTTGSSGASTYSNSTGVLNIPTYTLAGLGGQASSTNLTSLSSLSYVSTSFVKMTAAGTFALDTNTYLTSAVTTISFGTTGLTPNTATSGAVTVAGTLVAANGGTGQSLYTIGDLLYASATTTLSKLAAVAAGSYLRSAGTGTAPVWSTVIIPNAATLGDIWYGSAANAVSALGGSTVAGKRFLTQTGNGTVSAAPAWGQVTAADVTSGAALTKTDDTNVTLTLGGTPTTALLAATSLTLGWTGTLAVSRGGTGAGTLTGIVIGNGTSAMTAVSSTTALQVFRVNSAGTGYEFATISTGNGSVTSVSVVTANGISGTVATASTTPAITLTLGAITPTSVNGLTFTAAATGFTIAGGTTSKTLTISNTLTLAGTDSSTLNIGSGGTLGSAAFTASTAYQAASTNLTSLAGLTFASTSFVKMTAAGTFALDTNTYYLASNPSGYTNNTGTVTSVSVTTANGVSGSVATASTTPAITITLGAITPTSVNGLTFTAAATGFTVAGGTTSKTLTVSNTLTLAGTDSSTLNIGSGGTLGSAAFTASSAYQASNTNLTSLAGLTFVSTSFVKMTAAGTFALDTNTYLSSAITSLGTSGNGQTGATQTLAVGTTGSDFNISSSGNTHTFNIPNAGQVARGLVSTAAQTFTGTKTFDSGIIVANSALRTSIVSTGATLLAQSLNHVNDFDSSGAASIPSGTSYAVTQFGASGAVTESAAGTHELVANVVIRAITLSNNTGTTNNGATLYIEGAAGGTATITNNYAVWVDNGTVRLDGEFELQGISTATGANMLYYDTTTKRVTYGAAPSGSGSVSTVSVVSANGFAGTVANASSTPAITISTTITGLLKGNGTAISAAVANTDYLAVASPAYTGTLTTGTLGFTAANPLMSLQSSVNGFNQFLIQNTSTGVSASSDIIVNNNQSTDTTFYGDFGINGSNYTGSGSLALPNAVYLYAASGDLAIGTTTSNAIHFVVNNGATDAATIKTTGQFQLPGYTTTSSFSGTAAGYLAFDSSGNVITVTAPTGGGGYSVTSVSTTYSETATSGTKIIKADTTGGTFVVTLPTAVGNTATIIVKKTAGSAALTVDGAGTETIDGGLTATINKVYESITLISDNTNWQIV